MKLNKNTISNILFGVLLVALILPQSRKHIQITLAQLVSFSPSEIEEANQHTIKAYTGTFFDLEGNRAVFKASKGKVVLVNFWATWCPPCIAELPSLSALHMQFGEQVDFYFISNESPETLQSFLNSKNLELPVFTSVSQLPKELNYTSFPTTIVISKHGKIIIKEEGVAKWDSESVVDKLKTLIDE